MNLNIKAEGDNEHHKIEGIFKALARSIKMAVKRDIYKFQLPSSKEGQKEDDVIVADGVVDEQSHGGRNAGGQIVGEAVVANALGTARGGQHINGRSAVGHGDRTHRRTVSGAHDGKERHGAGNEIASKEGEEKEIGREQHHLARKTVNQIARERTSQQCRERVARQHKADGVLVGLIVLAQIERQQGGHNHERKENHEVRHPHLHIIRVPKSVLLSHNGYKDTEK